MHKYLSVLCLIVISVGQTSLNPNISLVGDLRYINFFDKNVDGKTSEFQFRGVEMVVENYLNPFARADVTIHFSDEELIDIEEAYVTVLKGLPLSSQLRFGRYFIPFGEILQKHEHVNSFLSYPSMHQAYFGEEGPRNLGFEVNFAFPLLDQFTELKLGVLEGNITPEPEDEDLSENKAIPFAYGAYYSIFSSLGDYTNIKTSFSYLSGAYDLDRSFPVNLFAFTTKFKWQPSDYTSFQLLGELFLNKRTELLENDSLSIYPDGLDIKNSGFFISAEYQFSKYYSIGGNFEKFTEPTGIERMNRKDFSIFASYAPVEETMLFRIKYGRDITFKSNQFTIQTIFSLGPHKAHQF